MALHKIQDKTQPQAIREQVSLSVEKEKLNPWVFTLQYVVKDGLLNVAKSIYNTVDSLTPSRARQKCTRARYERCDAH